MIRISTLIFVLHITLQCLAQNKTISGVLTDADGGPLPRVNIVIKGTTQGTVTDPNGYYSIDAPIGGVLIFSSVGFVSYEVEVKDDLLEKGIPHKKDKREKKKGKPSIRDSENRISSLMRGSKSGTHTLRAASVYILEGENGDQLRTPLQSLPKNIFKVKYLKPRRAYRRYGKVGSNGIYLVRQGDYYSTRGIQISFGTSYKLEKVSRLPDLQNTFSQGRPIAGAISWQGPETGNIFSWGPALNDLVYDGSAYAYDQSGRLVPSSLGSGQRVEAFDPYAIFKNGHTFKYNFDIKQHLKRNEIGIGWQGERRQGIVPTFQRQEQHLNLNIKSTLSDRSKLGAYIHYHQSKGNLVERGANLSQIFYSLATAPPTFDNANRLNHPENKINSYQLANGNPRSYGPGKVDNPFGLISRIGDRENLNKLRSYITWDKELMEPLKLKYRAGFDFRRSDNRYGLMSSSVGSPEGRYTKRTEDDHLWQSILAFNYHTYFSGSDNFELQASLNHNFSYETSSLNRNDGTGLSLNSFDLAQARQIVNLNSQRSRVKNEIMISNRLSFDDIIHVRLTNNSYISSSNQKRYLWLPSMGASFVFSNIYGWSGSILSEGKIYSSWSTSVKESPLIIPQRSFNSLIFGLSDLVDYFENLEVFGHSGLEAESIGQYELGVELDLFHNRVELNANYFQNNTRDALIPVLISSQEVKIMNLAQLRNKGFEIEIGYSHFRHRLGWETKINFSQYKNTVKSLNGDEESLPISGFTEVKRSLIAGQPYGVITGSVYQRGPQNQLIIGPDGFPLVDNKPGIIGDPNPDWTMGINHYLSWDKFSFVLVVEASYGGDIWNGTSNTLNYLGASQQTANQRGTTGFVFPGIHTDGRINTIPIDFANPATGLAGNRWVRYGWGGVAEEAIENGSWIRLSQVSIGYNFTSLLKRWIKLRQINLQVAANNLVLLTNYSGIDPDTRLFGYQAGAGLDYFNFPHTKSLEVSIKIKL